MGKMNTISLRLEELRENLYTFGFNYEPFVQECKLLCELGFVDEVNCIIHDFETKVYNEDF